MFLIKKTVINYIINRAKIVLFANIYYILIFFITNYITIYKAINEAINEMIINEGLFSNELGKRVKFLKKAVEMLDSHMPNQYVSADTMEPTQETRENLRQANADLKYNRDQEINAAYQRALQAKDDYENGTYLNPQSKEMARQRYQVAYQNYAQLKGGVEQRREDAQNYINSVNDAQTSFSKAFKQIQSIMLNLSKAIKAYLQAVKEGRINEGTINEDASANLMGNIFRGTWRDARNGAKKGVKTYNKIKSYLNFSKRKQEKAAREKDKNDLAVAIKQHRDKLASCVKNIEDNWQALTTNIFYFENYNDLYFALNDMQEYSSHAIDYVDESKVLETIKNNNQVPPQRQNTRQ